jgi:hypothetical protein
VIALGFNPLSGRVVAAAPRVSPFGPDVAWWLLETVLVFGLVAHGVRPRRGVWVWLVALWMSVSAVRFLPLVLTQPPS